MMKIKILPSLCFILLLLSASTSAQQRWWGSFTDAMTPAFTGLQAAETYHCCSQFSASRAVLNGATIHGVRFYLRDKTTVSDVEVWLSSARPTQSSSPDIMSVTVPQDQLSDLTHDQKMVEVMLPQPFQMPSGIIYVGYSFTQTSAATEADKNPVACAGSGKGGSGTFHLRTSKTLPSWNDVSSRYGALALQLLVSNASLPVCGVELQGVSRLVGITGTATETAVAIASAGLNEVTSLDYVVTADGQALAQQHYDLPAPLYAPGSAGVLPVSFTLPATAAATRYAVEITQVNGQPNGAAQRAADNQLVAVSRLATRRTVVEEYTGTWCTNCPRGMVGMENMAREFADRFVGIAVHNDDPMALAAYQSLVPVGIPKCSMDRQLVCDPYIGVANDLHYHAGEAFAQMLAQPSEADLSVQARWADEVQSTIGWTAATTFHLNASEADYALAFVLTADGLKGTTKDWWQVNGESGSNRFPDSDMDRFRNAPNPVQDISYDHVAVAVDGIVRGISGSIAAPIADGRQQTFGGTCNVGSNALVQDKNRLTAIVLLLNKTTGLVVNAAKTTIAPYDPDGIVTPTTAADGGRQPWSTIDGRRVLAPLRPGLYINSGKKIIIK